MNPDSRNELPNPQPTYVQLGILPEFDTILPNSPTPATNSAEQPEAQANTGQHQQIVIVIQLSNISSKP
jgi:hypothetical protein